MKPSNFNTYPWSSVFQKSENESIAQNVMAILQRTGDTWRLLSWKEYKKERLKDKDFSDEEKGFFDEVIDYCKSPDTAKLFAPDWKKAYDKFAKKK